MTHTRPHAGHAHAARPVRRVAPSLYRMSAAARLGLALAGAGLIWAAIGWALA